MRRFLLVSFLILTLTAACVGEDTDSSVQIHPTVTPTLGPTREPGPWRIMPLGESLTEGVFPNGHHSYRGYLEMMLRDAGYELDFVGTQWQLGHSGTDYEHEGHGGFTIGPNDSMSAGWPANIYDRIDYYLKTDPDIILLLIGINDIFPTETGSTDPSDADEKLSGLVDRILSIDPDLHIFVSSLAPVNMDRSEPWPEFEAINLMAEQIGIADADDQIYFMDMNRILAPNMGTDDYIDGLHFSKSGAHKVAQVWFDALQESELLNSDP